MEIKKGQKARVTNNYCHAFQVGDIVEFVEFDINNGLYCFYKEEGAQWLKPCQFVLIEDTTINYDKEKTETTKDKVAQSVMNDINQRSLDGIDKYGTTLEREDLSLKEWLQHAYEETLDKANYLKRAILKLENN